MTVGLFAYLHLKTRNFAAGRVLRQIDKHFTPGLERDRLRQAFVMNTRSWHSVFRKLPVGWGHRTRRRLQRVIADANRYVQTLNDTFTDPSGEQAPLERSAPSLAVVTPIDKDGESQARTEPTSTQV